MPVCVKSKEVPFHIPIKGRGRELVVLQPGLVCCGISLRPVQFLSGHWLHIPALTKYLGHILGTYSDPPTPPAPKRGTQVQGRGVRGGGGVKIGKFIQGSFYVQK